MSLTCPCCRAVLSDDGKTIEKASPVVAELEADLAAYREKIPAMQEQLRRLKAKRGKADAEKKSEPGRGKPEPPAGLSPYQRRKWEGEHGR